AIVIRVPPRTSPRARCPPVATMTGGVDPARLKCRTLHTAELDREHLHCRLTDAPGRGAVRSFLGDDFPESSSVKVASRRAKPNFLLCCYFNPLISLKNVPKNRKNVPSYWLQPRE